MAISRSAISATGTQPKTSISTRHTIAPRTRNLSASGSRNAPERVDPWRRARKPSMPSVSDSAIHSASAGHDAPESRIHASRSGVTSTRTSVTPFAGVAMAEGPNVPEGALTSAGGDGDRHGVEVGAERGHHLHLDE